MAIYRACGVFPWGTTVQTNIGANTALLEVVGSPTDFLLLKSMGFSGSGQTAGRVFSYAMGRSTAGAPPAQGSPFLPDDPNSPPTPAFVTTVWAGKFPSLPTRFLRRASISPAEVAGQVFRFPKGLGVYPGQTMSLFMTVTINSQNTTMDFQVEIDA
jgi:hypothetical protein